MSKMGFHQKWIDWMTLCLENVHYSIMINRDLVGPISPGKGLRQGDPLSLISLSSVQRDFLRF